MTPAETSILNEIEARLSSIKTSNGYSLTVKKVTRGRLKPFQPGDIPAINYWPVEHTREDSEYDLDKHTIRVVVDMRDVTRDETFPDLAAKMAADIITALNRSTASPAVSDDEDPELGETVSALDLSSIGYQIGEGQQPWVGVVLEMNVVYRSDSSDMFNYQP